MTSGRLGIALLVSLAGLLQIGTTSVAGAAVCVTSDQRQCWRTLSGPNYSLVAVGKSSAGAGIACAVQASQSTDWGGILHCYSPEGRSGAVITGRGGQEAQGVSGWFYGPDPMKRIVSLAIEPVTNGVIVHALRSDGNTFSAPTVWPLGTDPRMYFSPDVQAAPSGLRTIAFVTGLGLVGVTTANQLFLLSGLQWVAQPGSWVFVAGSSYPTLSLALGGTSGLSTQVLNVTGGAAPPTLSGSLMLGTSDPNLSFRWGNDYTRETPLGAGRYDAWAALPGRCPSGSNTPCILHSTRGISGPWSAWQLFPTGDIADSSDPLYPMPRSIQDAATFRNIRGEIWVIAGYNHLKFWAP
jgi:hypothetical protein